MSSEKTASRVLIYSHDSFGLGHLRRCRTIAHALVERFRHLSVLILSGSPIIGSFDFRSRVDFVRIPGVIKLRNGKYTSLSLHIDIEETLSIRSEIVRHTAEIFSPDIFIVDKEPLGLRDVMDEPRSLAPEWQRKKVMPALRDLYDEIWIYGLPQICDPLEGISLPRRVRQKIVYTGYLQRSVPQVKLNRKLPEIIENPYILVTTGGGGDGAALIEWVLRTYETQPRLVYPALLVLGPFMRPEHQSEFMERAARLPNVEAITFDAQIEELEANAVGVVAMGGYNTFCEILSLDKRSIIVPRTVPRLEQKIRAERAQELGLVRMLEDDGGHDPKVMAKALMELPYQNRPSEVVVPGLLEGLDNLARLVAPWLPEGAAEAAPAMVAAAAPMRAHSRLRMT